MINTYDLNKYSLLIINKNKNKLMSHWCHARDVMYVLRHDVKESLDLFWTVSLKRTVWENRLGELRTTTTFSNVLSGFPYLSSKSLASIEETPPTLSWHLLCWKTVLFECMCFQTKSWKRRLHLCDAFMNHTPLSFSTMTACKRWPRKNRWA